MTPDRDRSQEQDKWAGKAGLFATLATAAAGHSFRFGGIRVPVNVACAWQRGGEQRWTLITGWAVRDLVGTSTPAPAPGESQ